MQTKRPPLIVIALVLVALAAGGVYAYNLTRPVSSDLTASGTVEASQVLIAPELSGKVAEVLVQEGDLVQAGDVLFRLDAALPQAQRAVAAAGLATAQAAAQTAEAAAAAAQAQVDLILSAALAEQKAARSADWSAAQASELIQPAWYFEKTEQVAAVQAEEAAAQAALAAAQARLTSMTGKAAGSDFLAAENQLLSARSAFDVALNVLNLSAKAGQTLKDSAQKSYDEALTGLTGAQTDYNDAITTSGAADLLAARADLRVAQERYAVAQDGVRALQTGALSLKVLAAQKSLDQALAAAAQANLGVAQARASLALIDTQIAKLTVSAPSAGMVLVRSLEPGEVVMPGAGLLNLARLDDLTITVYIPEDRYGEIAIGQTARVMVDSFPGEIFTATVLNISGQAEFTPRNVQTVEGRKTTVFAIKLALTGAGDKLKPGMPADVLFN